MSKSYSLFYPNNESLFGSGNTNYFPNSFTFKKNLTVKKDLAVEGNETIAGSLNVQGTINAHSMVTVEDATVEDRNMIINTKTPTGVHDSGYLVETDTNAWAGLIFSKANGLFYLADTDSSQNINTLSMRPLAIGNPTASNHATTKFYTDNMFLHLAGGTLHGTLNMSNHDVIGVSILEGTDTNTPIQLNSDFNMNGKKLTSVAAIGTPGNNTSSTEHFILGLDSSSVPHLEIGGAPTTDANYSYIDLSSGNNDFVYRQMLSNDAAGGAFVSLQGSTSATTPLSYIEITNVPLHMNNNDISGIKSLTGSGSNSIDVNSDFTMGNYDVHCGKLYLGEGGNATAELTVRSSGTSYTIAPNDTWISQASLCNDIFSGTDSGGTLQPIENNFRYYDRNTGLTYRNEQGYLNYEQFPAMKQLCLGSSTYDTASTTMLSVHGDINVNSNNIINVSQLENSANSNAIDLSNSYISLSSQGEGWRFTKNTTNNYIEFMNPNSTSSNYSYCGTNDYNTFVIGNNTDGTRVTITSGGNTSLSSNLNMNTSNGIINCKDPTNAQDVSTKNYVDTNYLPLAGGTLTGDFLITTPQTQFGTSSTGNTNITTYTSKDSGGTFQPVESSTRYYDNSIGKAKLEENALDLISHSHLNQLSLGALTDTSGAILSVHGDINMNNSKLTNCSNWRGYRNIFPFGGSNVLGGGTNSVTYSPIIDINATASGTRWKISGIQFYIYSKTVGFNGVTVTYNSNGTSGDYTTTAVSANDTTEYIVNVNGDSASTDYNTGNANFSIGLVNTSDGCSLSNVLVFFDELLL